MMRRTTLLVVLAALLALAASADARSARRSVLNVMTAPLRVVGLIGHRLSHRAYRHRFAFARHHWRLRSHAGRLRGAAGVAAAGAGAAAGVAGVGAAAGAGPAPDVAGAGPASRGQVAAVDTTGRAAPGEQPPGGAASRSPVWAGPLYWPQAFDDLFDYVLQPESAGERFWAHGPRDLVEAIFPRAQTAGGASCGSGRSDVAASWRAEIAGKTQPNADQGRTLDELDSALAAANDAVKRACPAAAARLSANQRLDAMTDRLWAMRQAAILVRAPLENFTDSLTEEQNARWRGADRRADLQGAAAQQAAALCADPAAAARWPADRIAARVRPAPAQRQPLQTLQMTTLGMAKQLATSCPASPPATPLARLDAVEKRLNAMLYAARVTAPALAGFYGTLSEVQKSAFDGITPAAASQPADIPTVARGER
jgi:hypothetical protein